MDAVARFCKLAVKRGLTPGGLLDSSPADLDLLLVALRREFAPGRRYAEREVNEVLKNWLQSAGGMLQIDHVELRRWLVDLAILARDAYGHAYGQAACPERLLQLETELASTDFRRQFAEANEQESLRRAARKAAWQQAGAGI
jgi:hypothetical protein